MLHKSVGNAERALQNVTYVDLLINLFHGQSPVLIVLFNVKWMSKHVKWMRIRVECMSTQVKGMSIHVKWMRISVD